MFATFQRSWQLVKASWAVLSADKELIWFPILSGIVMLVTTLTFFIPIGIFWGIFQAVSESATRDSGGSTTTQIISVVLMFLYYLVSYAIVTYFNVALVGAAMIRLDGGDPTMRDGLKIANERLGKIITYAAISATVGTILQLLRERGGIVGSILSSLGGLAWNLASFFVVPILVLKDVSPWEAVKESTSLLKRTWGEQIVGGSGLGAVFGLLGFGIVLLGILLAVVFANISGWLAGLAILLMVLALIGMGVVSGALSGIFQAVVYRYAEAGVAPDNFDIEAIKGAFQPKNKR